MTADDRKTLEALANNRDNDRHAHAESQEFSAYTLAVNDAAAIRSALAEIDRLRELNASLAVDVIGLEHARDHVAAADKCQRRHDDDAREIDSLRAAMRENDRLFERLDAALAGPDEVAKMTREVGGFVSALNILTTADGIVDLACVALAELHRLRAAAAEERHHCESALRVELEHVAEAVMGAPVERVDPSAIAAEARRLRAEVAALRARNTRLAETVEIARELVQYDWLDSLDDSDRSNDVRRDVARLDAQFRATTTKETP